MSDIFISYARPDKERAELLAEAFSRKGWTSWWDREIPPGQPFDETIEHALSSARCVVVVWSRHSVASRWVKTEAAEGAERGILVPVLMEKVKIPLEFKRIEAADLSGWQNDPSDPEFSQLLRTVGGLIDGSAAARPEADRMAVAARSARRRPRPGLWAGIAIGAIGTVAALYPMGFFRTAPPHSSGEAGRGDSAPHSASEAGREGYPAAVGPAPAAAPIDRDGMNLLGAENGGHVVAATNELWRHAIDGDEKNWQYIDIGVNGAWAAYGFRDGRPARFHAFKVLILGSESWNLNEFELLAGNGSPTGTFESIGRFKTQNARFFKNAYQEFRFQPVRARYLKIRVISSHGFSSVGVYEFQLMGELE